ncbi:pimeloyl-ACP methyl ester carboxylesterase [Catenuloplanes nepalensis]|uniref:Pimeloyl-ACP methyl ester carboxylesterase n=1 Tax=Catenuloplanes nepalensis TaxID=587533 RepID=A0ABT9MU43_9ACTN|nr:alpha/beta fold hydrolase [Catenuloplanes nepalensis]MDP9794939.1 pimeloyl-ACP methyl ester carboxylesterase [Catenuloplanes nepalensis]
MSTYLLVHGAWHSGEAWDRVVPLLTTAGHRVLAPSLTGHGDTAHLLTPEVGLETYVDDVAGLIEAEDLTDVILVGHSFAGLVVSSVANRLPDRIGHLVYLDAMVPADGETAVDVMPITATLIEAAAASGTPWRVPPMPELPDPHGLFGITDPDDKAWVRGMLCDEPVLAYRQPVRLDHPAVAAIPRTHIHCVGQEIDGITRRPVPATAQVFELRSGHDCMVIVPDELAALLLKLA